MSRTNTAPLLAAFVALYASSTLVSMAVMSLGAALLLLVVLITGAQTGAPGSKPRHSPDQLNYRFVSLFLAFSCIVSLIAARLFPLADLGAVQIRWAADIQKLWYFAWAPILAMAFHRLPSAKLRTAWRAWFLTFGALSLVGVLQFWTGWPRRQPIPNLEGHFHSTLFLGHHLSVASIWIFPFFAGLAGSFSRPQAGLLNEWKLPRWLVVFSTILGGLTLFFGFSRTLWAALPVGLLLWGLLNLPSTLRLRAGIGLVALTVAGSLAAFQIPMVHDRLVHSMGTTDRFELWRANWELFQRRPVTGVGWHHNLELAGRLLQQWHPDSTSFVSHAHNNILEMLGSLGLMGTLAWLLWNTWLARALWRLAQKNAGTPVWVRELSQGWLAAFVVFHLNGLTQVNFWEGKVQHQLFWVAAWVLYWNSASRTTSMAGATDV